MLTNTGGRSTVSCTTKIRSLLNVASVTRLAIVFTKFLAIFERLFSIGEHIEPALVVFYCFWAIFRYYTWPKIGTHNKATWSHCQYHGSAF